MYLPSLQFYFKKQSIPKIYCSIVMFIILILYAVNSAKMFQERFVALPYSFIKFSFVNSVQYLESYCQPYKFSNIFQYTQGGANTHCEGGCKKPPPENFVRVHLCVCLEMENNRAKILNLVDCCISIWSSVTWYSIINIILLPMTLKTFFVPPPPS